MKKIIRYLSLSAIFMVAFTILYAQSDLTQVNQALEKYAQVYSVNSPDYADCLMWCSMICAQHMDMQQAKAFLDRSTDIYRIYGTGPFNGKDTLHEIMFLDIRATMEYPERSFYAARYFEQSRALKKEFFGETSEIYLQALLELSSLYAERLNYRKSSLLHNLGFNSYIDILRNEFCQCSEQDRADYWQKASGYIYKTIDLADRYAANRTGAYRDSLAGMAYNALLLSKGILLNATVNFDSFVYNSSNIQALELLSEKKSLASDGTLSRHLSDSLDYYILKTLRDAGQEYKEPLLMISWQDIQGELSQNDLAIEFYRNSSGGYGALMLKKGWKSPKIVKLKSFIKDDKRELSLEEALAENPFDLYVPSRSNYLWRISKAVWPDDILKFFPKTSEGKVYFSTDGVMQTCAIEYLPIVDPTNRDLYCLCDYYNLHRLSSTRELVRRNRYKIGNGSVIFGGLEYSPHQRLKTKGEVRAVSTDKSSSTIKFLEETIEEAYDIEEILNRDTSLHATPYTNMTGTEQQFKALNEKKKRIIHVATHGFYYPVTARDDYHRFLDDDSPMTRSGLFMSGAQKRFSGTYVPAVNDGILTSREISELNLSGAELITLSACETGRGDIGNDGVFGLQRAFKMANAQCILMSLWRVDDASTHYLMKSFYENWLSGYGKQESLRRATESVRQQPDWSNPKYWAAFILLDDIE